MKSHLPPDVLQDLFALCDALKTVTTHGNKSKLVNDFAAAKGVSCTTAYGWLKQFTHFSSGRKVRSDCGATKVPLETLHFIAANIHESTRKNGRSIKPTNVAMNIAAANGLTVNASASRFNTLMRASRMNAKAQANARNHIRMRSEHPNHVHQIDPSVCVLYYMNGKQCVMREEEFNKNKPAAADKIKLKVWRYVRYDHASGCLDVRYFEKAGEDQHSLFEFLMWTWSKQPERLSFGVPKMLLWDKGSANTSHSIQRLLDALGVIHETHGTHHAWVKGGVESGNRIVERSFESRLKDEPVHSVEQLNASVARWARDYNANAIKHVDSRIKRDSGIALVRDELWQSILSMPEYLLELPEREVCTWFMRGKEETRQIRDSRISFVHPQSKHSEVYDLSQWTHLFAQKEKVRVSPLLLGDCLLRVEIEQLGSAPKLVDVTPVRDFDGYGRDMNAALIGTDRRIAPHTAAQNAAKIIAKTAYGEDVSLDDAEKLRNKQSRPFAHMNDGKGIVSHSYLGQDDLPTRLIPAATALDTPAVQAARSASKPEQASLSLSEACMFIKGAMQGRGATYEPSTYSFLQARYPDGRVPQEAAEALAYNDNAQQATGTHDAEADTSGFTGLRSVK
jgi:hypothetical protein